MHRHHHLAAIVLILPLFGACSSSNVAMKPTRPSTTANELAALYSRAPAQFTKVKVHCSIHQVGEKETLPTLTLLSNGDHKTVRGQVNELIYPKDFEFPKLLGTTPPADQATSFPIMPTHPVDFTTSNTGWTLTLAAEPRDSFIYLRGTLTEQRMGHFVQAAGKPYEVVEAETRTVFGRPSRVILSENRVLQPSFIREDFPILVAADPLHAFRIPLNEDGTKFAEFRCEPLPSS